MAQPITPIVIVITPGITPGITLTLVKCFIVTENSFSLFAAVDAESDDEAEQYCDDDGKHHDDD